MGYRWVLSGIISLLLLGTMSVSAMAKEMTILVLGQYQGQYETIMVDLYDSKSYSSQIISIHPGSVFLDGDLVLQSEMITQALDNQGIRAVQKALGEYLGLDITNYLIVDYEGAQAVIDAMGGVMFDLPYQISLPANGEEASIDIKPGLQLFNGQIARRFLRYRSSNLNGPEELQVIKLQQLFLNAMIQQLANQKWRIIPVALKLPKMIKTNLGLGQILELALDVLRSDEEILDIHFGIIPGTFAQVNEDFMYHIRSQRGYRAIEF